MADSRTLRSANRETTPEYNDTITSKAGGRVVKSAVKTKLASLRQSSITPLRTNKTVKKTKTASLSPTTSPITDDNTPQVTITQPEIEPYQELQTSLNTISENKDETMTTRTSSPTPSQKTDDRPTTPKQNKGKNILDSEYSFAKERPNFQKQDTQLSFEETQLRMTKIFVQTEQIPGTDTPKKILFIKEKLSHFKTFKYARSENHTGDEILVALFSDYADAIKACETPINDDIDYEPSPFRLVPIPHSATAHAKTIRIWDVPTHFTKKDISIALQEYGPVENITLQNSLHGKEATATFQKREDYEKLNNIWAILFGKFSMRIFPYYATRETKIE
jgi:hypothetical protein